MADCECLGGCPFFHDRMANMDKVAEIYKKKYCLGDNTDCARHIVFKAHGKGSVPGDLYPNMQARALEIIKNPA